MVRETIIVKVLEKGPQSRRLQILEKLCGRLIAESAAKKQQYVLCFRMTAIQKWRVSSLLILLV
jgi:hypothetical protein